MSIVTFPYALLLVQICAICGLLKQHRVAYNLFENAVTLQPNWGMAYQARAAALRNLGEYQKAFDDYTHAFDLGVAEPRLYYFRGLCAYELARNTDVVHDFTICIDYGINRSSALYYRATANAYLKNYLAAAYDYNQYLPNADTERVTVLIQIGFNLYKFRDYASALAAFDTVLQENPENPTALLYRVLLLYKLKEYKLALATIDTTLQIQPEDPTALLYYGIVLSSLKDYSGANIAYDRALEHITEPGFMALTLHDRGINFLFMNRVAEARLDFQNARNFDTLRLDAALVLCCLDFGPEPPHAEVIAQFRAIAQTEGAASNYTEEIILYIKHLCEGIVDGLSGRWADALQEMESAIANGPDQDLVHFWHGMAYAYLGRDAEALAAFDRARSEKLPPILFKPLLWLQRDRPDFYPAVVPYLLDES